MVHHYERYAWMVLFVVMLFLLGLGGHAGFDINAQEEFEDKPSSGSKAFHVLLS
jgi:hypothetical protein